MTISEFIKNNDRLKEMDYAIAYIAVYAIIEDIKNFAKITDVQTV